MNRLRNLALACLTSLSVSSCVGIPRSDLENYAENLYEKDFAHLEKSPKGFESYPIGTIFQYRDKICFFLFGNNVNNIWPSFLRLAREKIGAEEYNFRKKRHPQRGGVEFYSQKELTNTCLEIDSNPINGNGDGVAHPEEITAALKFFPKTDLDSSRRDNRR